MKAPEWFKPGRSVATADVSRASYDVSLGTNDRGFAYVCMTMRAPSGTERSLLFPKHDLRAVVDMLERAASDLELEDDMRECGNPATLDALIAEVSNAIRRFETNL